MIVALNTRFGLARSAQGAPFRLRFVYLATRLRAMKRRGPTIMRPELADVCEAVAEGSGLEKSRRPKRCRPAAADDDMVVQGDADSGGGILDLARHLDIGARRRWIAAWVIVHHDEGARVQLQCAFDDFARIHRRVEIGRAHV